MKRLALLLPLVVALSWAWAADYGANSVRRFADYPPNLACASCAAEYLATNATANTNLTLDFDVGARDLWLTNNVSLTNLSNLTDGMTKSVMWFVTPVGTTRTVVYPSLGAASFGAYWSTNANAPMWTSLTNGSTYVLSLTARGTNIHAAISAWK
jgi:hypothetical protein